MAFIDVTGLRFARLTALRRVCDVRGNFRVVKLWRCQCDCGGSIDARIGDLRSGHIKSCGCMRREHCRRGPNKIHGEGANGKTTPEYEIWKGMKARCFNPSHVGYKYYGARGIRVCQRWRESYQEFLSDMGRRPSSEHSIDRIDNDGNYEPANCRWATHAEQARERDFSALGVLGGRAKAARRVGSA